MSVQGKQSVSAVKAKFTTSSFEALRSNRDLFQALAAHTPVGIFISSPGDGCVYVNERWCELTGLTPEQAMGDGWAAALHPDDAPRVNREWAEATAHDRDSIIEYRFVRPDGGVTWVEGYAAALRDDAGTVIGWVGTCIDLTARKEAEGRFRRAFEDAPIGTALGTPDGRWLQVNPALCRLLGYTADELTRLTFLDITHPADIERSLEHSRRQLDGDVDLLRIEKRLIRSDGQVVWAALTSTLVRDAAGKPLHFVAQVEDVTESVLARRALEEAEERFRRAFEDAPIGMAIVSLDGRWLRVNETLCELTGYTEEELLGRTFMDITHPDDVEPNLGKLGTVIDGDARTVRIEKRYVRPNGRIVWVNISSSLIHDADGNPLHLVSQIEDVTDRKRAESKLQDLADHDPLTGLLNRRRFDEELHDTLVGLRRHGGHAALMLIDLDQFKLVNDTFGHKIGDDVIVAAAAALSRRLRGTDSVARFGGDEFAAILHSADAESAGAVARDLAAAIQANRVASDDADVTVTSSIGIALLDRDTGGADEALAAADSALYAAKNDGRDRIALAG